MPLNVGFFLDEQTPSSPPTHHALVILQPFQAHRPAQPHKMGGLQLPAAYQNRTVMFLDDRSEKTSTQQKKILIRAFCAYNLIHG